jgi:hypothetical protein
VLVFALNNLGVLVSISEVANGLACECICPNCNDPLIARNAGKKVAHSFAHTSKAETRKCLMTALHKFAQNYFKSGQSIDLPQYKHTYLGITKTKSVKHLLIHNASIEYSVDVFSIDVKLETLIGKIFIEIRVTSDCSVKKIAYLKANKLPTLEFNLSKLVGRPYEEVIDILSNADQHAEWLCGWDITELEKEILSDIKAKKKKEEASRQLETIKRKRIAQNALNNMRKNLSIGMPAKVVPFHAIVAGKESKLEAKVLNAGSWNFQDLTIKVDDENCLLITCKILSKKGKPANNLTILFPYTESALNRFKPELNSAVLCRIYRKGSYPYKWLSYPQASPIKLQNAKEKAINTKKESLEYFQLNDLLKAISG